MPRDIDETSMMLETMAIAEPAAAVNPMEWKERSLALLLMFPVAPGVTTLPPCRRDTSLWLV